MKAKVTKPLKDTKAEKEKLQKAIREFTVGGVTYEMPAISVLTFMDYTELRDDIYQTESLNSRFTRAQFEAMIKMLVKIYGEQFTEEDLLAADSGITAGDIIAHFGMIELAINSEVGSSVEKIRTNFTSGE